MSYGLSSKMDSDDMINHKSKAEEVNKCYLILNIFKVFLVFQIICLQVAQYHSIIMITSSNNFSVILSWND